MAQVNSDPSIPGTAPVVLNDATTAAPAALLALYGEDVGVKVQAMDGEPLEIPMKAAVMCLTLANLVEDAGIEQVIPLPNVSRVQLEKVITYLLHHMNDPPVVKDDTKPEEKRTDDIIPWDLDYFRPSEPTPEKQHEADVMIFSTLKAANYLDVKPLLHMTAKTIANMFKGKTPEEIRKRFNVEPDFTPEEEEAIKKENEWLNEQ